MVRAQVYSKAAKIPLNHEISDKAKNCWVVGELIGEGGFGAIYACDEKSKKEKNCVIKIEPSGNGPMFTEVNFYRRVCKQNLIDKWVKEKGLSYLGIPRFISACSDDRIRFLVMDRYGSDFHKILKQNTVAKSTILQVTLNLIDILEYIHNNKYVHADIKALNILQDIKDKSKIYLLDFGMVALYEYESVHKPDTIDKKRKHNGTLDFCPRDSHIGRYMSRRSDIESLLYNLIFWLTWDNIDNNSSLGNGKLPWLDLVEKYNANPSKNNKLLDKVLECKEKYMADIPSFLKEVGLHEEVIAKNLMSLLRHANNLKYDEEPNYDQLRQTVCTMIDQYRFNNPKQTSPNNNDLNLYRKLNWSNNDNKNNNASSTTCLSISRSPSTSAMMTLEVPITNGNKRRGTLKTQTNQEKRDKTVIISPHMFDNRKYLKSSQAMGRQTSRMVSNKKTGTKTTKNTCRTAKFKGDNGDDDDDDEEDNLDESSSVNRSRSVSRRDGLRQSNNSNKSTANNDLNNSGYKSNKSIRLLPGDIDLFIENEESDEEHDLSGAKPLLARKKPVIARAKTQPQRMKRKPTEIESPIASTSTINTSEIIPGLKSIRKPIVSTEPIRTGSLKNTPTRSNLVLKATNQTADEFTNPSPADIIPGLKYKLNHSKSQRMKVQRRQSRLFTDPKTKNIVRTLSTANSIIPGLKSVSRAEKQKRKQRKNRASLVLKNSLRKSMVNYMIADNDTNDTKQ